MLALLLIAYTRIGGFGDEEGVQKALRDDANTLTGPFAAMSRLKKELDARQHRRIHEHTSLTDVLGLNTIETESDRRFPILISHMLDYQNSAVFIFSDLFGASFIDDPVTVIGPDALFVCSFDFGDLIVNASLIHAEHTLIAKCRLPLRLQGKATLKVTLTRYGGLSFQKKVVWSDLSLSQTPIPVKPAMKLKLTGCLSFNYHYNGLGQLLAWLAYHQLKGFDHVLVYDNGPGVTSEELDRMHSLLAPFVSSGFVTVVPWLLSQLPRFGGLMMAFEDLLYHDCLHRMRGRTEWLSNPHSDEFFMPKPPFRSLAEVLDAVKARVPTAVQAMLYEHPLVLLEDAEKTVPSSERAEWSGVGPDEEQEDDEENTFRGDPRRFFKLWTKNQVLTSDIPCGRNTGLDEQRRNVEATEQPFEGIINPEAWESWHAPGGSIRSEGWAVEDIRRKSAALASREWVAESKSLQEKVATVDPADVRHAFFRKRLEGVVILDSQHEAAIHHLSPNYERGEAFIKNCIGFEGLGEKNLTAMVLRHGSELSIVKVWPVTTAVPISLQNSLTKQDIDCIFGAEGSIFDIGNKSRCIGD